MLTFHVDEAIIDIWSSQYIPAGQHLNHHQIFVYVDKIPSFCSLLKPLVVIFYI